MKRIGNTDFDLEYCARFKPDQLRKIYNGESEEVLNELISAVYPKKEAGKKDQEKAKTE